MKGSTNAKDYCHDIWVEQSHGCGGFHLHLFEIRQSTIYYAGLLGRWDKRIVDQESDVPSIIFFILFIDWGNSNLFIFIYVIL